MTGKKKLVRELASLLRRNRLSYREALDVFREARLVAGLRSLTRRRALPKLLPEASLRAYYEAVDRSANLQHQVMLRLLLFTAVRSAELVSLRVEDVDLEAGKIFLERGKGDKDRYILYPDSFRLALRAYLNGRRDGYLFESSRGGPYSTRRIRQIVAHYAVEAGIPERVHPHLFRHQMLSYLTAQGVPDAAIQLISGHSSRESLKVYQHLSLQQVSEGYQEAVKKGIGAI